MLFRAIFLGLVLVLPFRAEAAQYVVGAGDSLGVIAKRYHISVHTLAQLNKIPNVNLVQVGRILFIPARATPLNYHVRWGDSLLAIAAHFGMTVAGIRAMNPSLGAYPLAGEWLRLCSGCGGSVSARARAPSTTIRTAAVSHLVRPGDTLLGIASRYGTSSTALMTANKISNPNHIVLGTWLSIPRVSSPAYDPWSARSLIVQYARLYGINPALPLAVGWQESGFNQSAVSPTGALGVMQVEPYTGKHISRLLGRPFNLYNVDDNIHAGVYWLAQLLVYYGGDQRLAAAAYYEGSSNLATRGFFDDTVQYVNSVLALRSQFGG